MLESKLWRNKTENKNVKGVKMMGSIKTYMSAIGLVRPNTNHNFQKIDLSDIKRYYLFKLYFSTDLFYNKNI